MVQWYNSTVLQCYSSTVVQQYRFLLPEWDVEMENVTMFHLATEGSTKKTPIRQGIRKTNGDRHLFCGFLAG